MDNNVKEKCPADAKYIISLLSHLLINTVEAEYKVAVDTSKQLKYVLIIIPASDLSIFRTTLIKGVPIDNNFFPVRLSSTILLLLTLPTSAPFSVCVSIFILQVLLFGSLFLQW